MMERVIIGIVILFIALVYLLFLFSYIMAMVNWTKATKTKAEVLEVQGKMKLKTGDVSFGVPRMRTFYKYLVFYEMNGEKHTEVAELKKKNYQIGQLVNVRYTVCKDGSTSLESEAFLQWTGEMAIGYTLGIILGVVGIILNG